MMMTSRAGDSEARRRGKSSGGSFSLSPLLLVSLSAVMLVSTACSLGGGGATATPPSTRAATQTPWIVYVPITVTPMPATFTPLPTVTVARQATATRTVAKPAATKAAVVLPTKPPVVAGPTATLAPTCSAGAVTPLYPENGTSRKTHPSGPGSDTFMFKWTPFQQGESDPQMGYRIDIESKMPGTNKTVNGDAVYISHNAFLKERSNGAPQQYIYDARAVHGLAGGGDANVAVFWKVTVVKTSGGFDDLGHVTGTVVNCGPPSQTWTITLIIE